MRGNELLDRMDLIDPEYIEAANITPKKRRKLPGWLSAAACLSVLLLAAQCGIDPARPELPTASTPTAAPTDQTQAPTETVDPDYGLMPITDPDWEPYYNQYTDKRIVSDSKRVQIPGYFIEELTSEELRSLTPRARMLWMELSGDAGFNGEGELIDLFLTITTSDPETEISLLVSQYGSCDAIILDQEPRVTLCGGVSYTLYQRDSRNGRTYFSADTACGEWLWSFSVDVPTEKAALAKQDFQSVLACFAGDLDREPDFSAITPEYIPEYFDHQLSLTDALDDPAFGAYFLPELPSGYVPESIRRYMDYQNNFLSGLWCNGYDDLSWYVTRITDADRSRITAISDTRNYDLSLYPIPRAESVPEELRQIVDDPIFLAEELTLEAVLARAYRIQDAGDTDGWRMDFSVLYGDILVKIRTKGVDPEWLYHQLVALPNP